MNGWMDELLLRPANIVGADGSGSDGDAGMNEAAL
jgi:hypothetical protein